MKQVGPAENFAEQIIELPQYRCHKVVRAARITGMEDLPDGTTKLVLGKINGFTLVKQDYIVRHSPKIGGYYVVYPDQYESYSPQEPFEQGYTKI